MNPPAADEQSLRDLINSAPPQHLRTALLHVLAEITAARRRDHRPPPSSGLCASADAEFDARRQTAYDIGRAVRTALRQDGRP
ncbi:hypothetical protein [Streptomyces sp. NPDC102409]|uniref:hypothetical protein n=1 Tax=Streptomyces sp. NPDC102409 TaxID=3366172 RepID=UPI003822BEE5